MKAVVFTLLLLAGCAAVPMPLSEFRGWSSEEIGSDRFRINVGEGKKDKMEEALLYAASFTLQRGYRAFGIMDEDGKGESGTWFFWNQGYDGVHGMWGFTPGKFFTIVCRRENPPAHGTWFDPKELLKKKPNQTPEPTAPSGRGSS